MVQLHSSHDSKGPYPSTSRRIAITGGRDTDRALVSEALLAIGLCPEDTLLHGACRGADLLAASIASSMGVPTEPFPADWARYGRAAGPIRNEQMLRTGVGILVAFPGGTGTANCVQMAQRLGITVLFATDLAHSSTPHGRHNDHGRDHWHERRSR